MKNSKFCTIGSKACALIAAVTLALTSVTPVIFAEAPVTPLAENSNTLDSGAEPSYTYNSTNKKLDIFTNGGTTEWRNDKNILKSEITTVELHEKVTGIAASAFLDCTGLTAIDMPDGITFINDKAFKSCSELTTIDLPKELNKLGDSTFFGCGKLTTIRFSSQKPCWLGVTAFFGLPEAYKIYVPAGTMDAYKKDLSWKMYEKHIFAEENGGSSGGSGGGSGGGGGGGSSTITSSLVSGTGSSLKSKSEGVTAKNAIDNPVGSKSALQPITNAVSKAVSDGAASANASISFSNYSALTTDGVKALNDAVTKAVTGKNIKLDLNVNFDQNAGKTVVSRVSVNPAELAKVMTGTVKLGVSADQKEAAVAQVNSHFAKYYSNKVVSVVYNEKNALDVSAEFAGKLDLEKTFGNTQNLYFYSYDNASNTYTLLQNPNYFVDTNGYAHITAPFGGSILATNAPLSVK